MGHVDAVWPKDDPELASAIGRVYAALDGMTIQASLNCVLTVASGAMAQIAAHNVTPDNSNIEAVVAKIVDQYVEMLKTTVLMDTLNQKGSKS